MAYIKKEVSEMVLIGLQRAIDEEFAIKKRGDKFRVKNLSNNQTYTVSLDNDMVTSCTCPHHENRHIACKHMFTVLLKSKSQYKLNI